MDEPTLARAVELHLRAMRAKSCAPRSIETLTDEVARHLGDWLDRPLASLSRDECATRHEDLTDRRGPYVANRVMQQLRAVYNTAARRFEALPPVNPVVAVTFNRVRRRREPIPWAELPAWRARVDALSNPVRRDLQLFLLFTGLRSLDARTVRFEHVDLERGTLHRPRPKGGEDRAFTVPVAAVVRELLERRRRENRRLFPDPPGGSSGMSARASPGLAEREPPPGRGAGGPGPVRREEESASSGAASGPGAGWVFPARDRRGRVTHVVEPKEQRLEGGRKRPWLPSPHRLRDTFASAAHEARVHPLDLKVLLNHALPTADDVTQGYIRPSVEHLRGCVEAVAEFLEERMGGT